MIPSLRDGTLAVLVPPREVHPGHEENHRSEWHRDVANNIAVNETASRCVAGRGAPMELKSFVTTLVELVWERERRMGRQMDTAVLGYVRDAVTAELHYRRTMHELDRRIAPLAEPGGAIGGA